MAERRKVLLLILDGFGLGDGDDHDAIALAAPPFWNDLWEHCPHSRLCARDHAVGLPEGCLSGSEVGHLTIGAGRVLWQGVMRIESAIQDGFFFDLPVLQRAAEHLTARGSALHIVGLLSDGGIHSHYSHLLALIDWARRHYVSRVYLHLFLDGRDMAQRSAADLCRRAVAPCLGDDVRLATVCGRAIAMDRAENWERTARAFRLLTEPGTGEGSDAAEVIERAYADGITDEFMPPTRLADGHVADGDAVIFFNFRADRMRQLTAMFRGTAPGSVLSDVRRPHDLYLASMTDYDSEHGDMPALFEPEYPKNTLGEWVSSLGLRQFRIAETEKYAHITYFLNGGREGEYRGEERKVVASLGLTNYAAHPEMSLPEVTTYLSRVLERREHDLVVCNIANGDMVGHSGDLGACVQAVRAIDGALATLVPAAEANGYTCVITADHGNVEKMRENDEPHSAHTFNDVPLVITDHALRLPERGALYQVAPTVLAIMGLPRPPEMADPGLLL